VAAICEKLATKATNQDAKLIAAAEHAAKIGASMRDAPASRDRSALHAVATATAAAGSRATAVVDAAWQREAATLESDRITDIILGALE
jgi:hypothetical protein